MTRGTYVARAPEVVTTKQEARIKGFGWLVTIPVDLLIAVFVAALVLGV